MTRSERVAEAIEWLTAAAVAASIWGAILTVLWFGLGAVYA
jgi:hypothetical protein